MSIMKWCCRTELSGNGIINADGELWRVQRKAGLHFLSGSNMKVLIDVALPKYLEDTLSTLKSCDGSQIDLEAVFHELTTQLMGRMAYDVRSLLASQSQLKSQLTAKQMDMHADDSFTKAFEYASGATGERFQNPLWQITESFTGARFRRAVSEVKQFGKEIVKNALCKTSKADSEFETSGSLISSLLDSIDDHEMVADAALNYLSAGRDTTAQALTWTLDQLMRNPDGIAKIRQEEGHTVTSRPYTLAAFYEGLRLFPPVPFEIKQCQQATILPDGTALPKNAIVFWSIWAMGRSNNWGDGNTFRPERWLVDGKFVAKSAFEFPVFNGGPRMCLGKKMAESIAAMVIARLLEEFDFVAVGDGSARKSKNSLTLPMEGGLPCIVKARPSQKRACI